MLVRCRSLTRTPHTQHCNARRLTLDARCHRHHAVRACNPVTFPSPCPSFRQSTVGHWLNADARLEHPTLDVAMPDTRHLLQRPCLQPRHLSITSHVFSTVD